MFLVTSTALGNNLELMDILPVYVPPTDFIMGHVYVLHSRDCDCDVFVEIDGPQLVDEDTIYVELYGFRGLFYDAEGGLTTVRGRADNISRVC